MFCSELVLSFACVCFAVIGHFILLWGLSILRANLASTEKSAAWKVGLTLPRPHILPVKAILVRRKLRNNSQTTTAFVLHTGVLNNWRKMKIYKKHQIFEAIIYMQRWFLFKVDNVNVKPHCTNSKPPYRRLSGDGSVATPSFSLSIWEREFICANVKQFRASQSKRAGKPKKTCCRFFGNNG